MDKARAFPHRSKYREGFLMSVTKLNGITFEVENRKVIETGALRNATP